MPQTQNNRLAVEQAHRRLSHPVGMPGVQRVTADSVADAYPELTEELIRWLGDLTNHWGDASATERYHAGRIARSLL